jgi:cystathionine beta-lyase/cystathionine gamma-synthase
MKKDTVAVHAGTRKDELYPGTNSPVYVSTSYAYLDSEERVYPRYFNTPNQDFITSKLSALEGSEDAIFFSSGMAAVSSVLFTFLKKGDHAIFQPALYGGTFHMVVSELENYGIEFSISNSVNVADIEKEIRANTKLIYIETPSNPLLEITDISAVAKLARSKGILTAIDSTFASPINQNPYILGIDLVIHSATKYLSGHSDLAAGALATRKDLATKVRQMALNLGGSLNALDCYLMERSMKTLSVRVNKQNENAMKIALVLNKHSSFSKVFYPGLETHTGHIIAKKQMSGFGGMIAFELSKCDPVKFQKSLKLIRPSMSLGGVDSIICSPALTSHRHLSSEEKAKSGITDKVLRLSVGIEDADDLIQDLLQALDNH